MPKEGFRTERFPVTRRSALDAGRLGRRRHIVHALIEVDVTVPREALREHRRTTGERLSFTAYVIHRLARAIQAHPHLHAYLDWRRRLVIFDHVNINCLIEVDADGVPVPMPHVFKRVDERDYPDIDDELRSVRANPSASPGWKYLHWMLRLPGFVRRWFAWVVTRVPRSFRAHSSTVLVSAVGMFGAGGGWGIPKANQTLTVTLGGIAEKPGVVEGEIAVREYLSVTISIDHDVVDGAPAARFLDEFRRLLEEGPDPSGGGATSS